MIKGLNIVELAQKLMDQQTLKHDYVTDTRTMHMESSHNMLDIQGTGTFEASDLAHSQIAQRTGIPKRYYDTMRRETPDLLADNVNRWFQEKPARRMVRTMDNTARAFLSDRYRRVDNDQIAQAVLPALVDSDAGFDIVSSEITDAKMYIQARLPRIEGEVKQGDPVQAGLIITNSETGLGALDIRPMIYRLICTNGMVSGKTVSEGRMRKTHLGAQVQAGNDNIVFQDDTQAANDQALMLQIRDAIKQLSDPKQFMTLMEKMRTAATSSAIQRPVQAVEQLSKAYTLPQAESDNILEQLIKGQDYSQWGLLNAVTIQANDNSNYDRAIELETLGGDILAMAPKSWESIATAA